MSGNENELAPGMDHVAAIEVPLSVVLAEKAFSLEQILDLRPGVVLDFSRRHDSPLDILVSGSRIGRGRALDIGERLGVRMESDRGTGSDG